jgi:hypothetical protein
VLPAPRDTSPPGYADAAAGMDWFVLSGYLADLWPCIFDLDLSVTPFSFNKSSPEMLKQHQ